MHSPAGGQPKRVAQLQWHFALSSVLPLCYAAGAAGCVAVFATLMRRHGTMVRSLDAMHAGFECGFNEAQVRPSF